MNYGVAQYKVFMRKTGLFDMIANHLVNNLVDYAFGVETGLDSNGRKNRGGHQMEDLVEKYIVEAGFVRDETYFKEMYIKDIQEKWGIDLSALSSDGKSTKHFDFVVKTKNMVYRIETNFYTGGGSKLNEAARSYELLFQHADAIDGFTFVWFTDGIGWKSARQLYETIMTLSESHQVVLTTHSPLFVNRTNINENIIVNNGKATPVKKIKEIRDVLGTHVSDNLTNAEHVLVVEGEDDKIALDKLLPNMSATIKHAIQNGTLIIDYIGGSGNLPYKLSLYRDLQCTYHVLLDNDDAGRRAGEDAERQGLLEIRNVTYTVCNGLPNAEMEDCYSKDVYKDTIWREFGVNIDVSEFRGSTKWSDRVKKCFLSQGKQWTDIVEKRVKLAVVNVLPEDANIALDSHKRSSIDAVVHALEVFFIKLYMKNYRYVLIYLGIKVLGLALM